MSTLNIYYYDPKAIDLGKIREQANRAATGTLGKWSGPENAIIHFHDHDNPCKGQKHERYRAVEEKHEEAGSLVMTENLPEIFYPEEKQVSI